jgi:hypothetical protein
LPKSKPSATRAGFFPCAGQAFANYIENVSAQGRATSYPELSGFFIDAGGRRQTKCGRS